MPDPSIPLNEFDIYGQPDEVKAARLRARAQALRAQQDLNSYAAAVPGLGPMAESGLKENALEQQRQADIGESVLRQTLAMQRYGRTQTEAERAAKVTEKQRWQELALQAVQPIVNPVNPTQILFVDKRTRQPVTVRPEQLGAPPTGDEQRLEREEVAKHVLSPDDNKALQAHQADYLKLKAARDAVAAVPAEFGPFVNWAGGRPDWTKTPEAVHAVETLRASGVELNQGDTPANIVAKIDARLHEKRTSINDLFGKAGLPPRFVPAGPSAPPPVPNVAGGHQLQNLMTRMVEGSHGADQVKVQIPGHPPGPIHRSQLQRFLAKHPDAKVLE